MCLPLECFIGRRFKEDPHGGSLPKGSGSVTAKPATQYYSYPAPAERSNSRTGAAHHTNGYNKAPAYDQQKHSVAAAAAAAVEQGHKAANDAWRGHNWPVAGAGAVKQERAYVHSGARTTLQTQPAMKAMVAVDGAAYSYPNYGRVPAHRQEYYHYN